jgi:hypothetical protein
MPTSSVLWLVLTACQQTDPAEPRSDALDTLIEQVLLPSGFTEDDVLVHEVGHLTPGTVVEAAFSGEPSEISEPTTLFLLDELPGAAWAHEVTWIYVDDDGDLHDELHDMFPAVDGEGFLPENHPAAWGMDWQPVDPESIDEDEELTLWDEGSGGGTQRGVPDPCQPPLARKAVTISGGLIGATQDDEFNWRTLLGRRGYQVTSLRPTRSDPRVTAQEVVDALAAAGGGERLEELVVVYSGHGLQQGGTLAFGGRTLHGTLSASQLVNALANVEARKLTIVLASCYSGQLAESLPAALKAAGLKETAIVVQASTQPGDKAWIEKEGGGSAFMRRLFDQVAQTDPGEPIPWKDLVVPKFNADTLDGVHPQEPVPRSQPRCVPEILHMLHPERQECLASWIHPQDYDRNVTLFGLGFGGSVGRVEMEQEDGDWVTVPVSYWSDEAIMLNLPMRRDGFPANGVGPSVADVEPPGSNWTSDGRYVVRVTPADGESSDPEPVEVVYQVYEQLWTPTVFYGWDFPDWVELWHPLTPEALWTNGPTMQLSEAWNASTQSSPIPLHLSVLDFDVDQAHVTSPQLLGVGSWSYDLPPALRNLATAYDQSLPSYQYWGFRAAFPDDDVTPDTWGFTLVYD